MLTVLETVRGDGKGMLPNEPNSSASGVHRLEPDVKAPKADLLEQLAPQDVKVLRLALSEPIEYVPHALLDDPAVIAALEALPTMSGLKGGLDDSGAYQLNEQDHPLSACDPEQIAFLRYNHFRRRLFDVLAEYRGRRLTEEGVATVLRWCDRIEDARGDIVRDNMPLVLAMVKRTRIRNVDPADLISEGNLALLRAVNKFDWSRGYRFSTYACRAILKSFSRVATRTSRYRGHFPTEYDPVLDRSDHLERRREDVVEDCVHELREILDGTQGKLSQVERDVIKARFALDQPAPPTSGRGKTLEQVGEQIGVTKERVRQIQNKALTKLRGMLDRAVLA